MQGSKELRPLGEAAPAPECDALAKWGLHLARAAPRSWRTDPVLVRT